MRILFQGVGKTRRYFDAQRDLWPEQTELKDIKFEVEVEEVFTILGSQSLTT